jgi:TetR/AcrR family transcriptional repressor of nem operon
MQARKSAVQKRGATAMTTKAKNDTRTALLQVGMEIMVEKGYSNTGIQEIIDAVNVPKGSFYYYFDSKETYAVEIIRFFDLDYSANLVRILQHEDRSPMDRLRDYCDTTKAMLIAQDCRKGCLIGNLSQEMADQSEVLRTELCKVMNKWRDIIADCMAEGQVRGQITKNRTPRELAELFSSAWTGATLRAKTVKNPEPLNTVIDLMFNEVLKA